ncbi:MAG: hypothetical protein ACE5JV_00745 [Nitrososphaerales archaeon]
MAVVQMKYPLRNLVYEKIKEQKNVTDADLMKMLSKEGVSFTESQINKTLLDLEIYGLIRVGWITKDKRRIELAKEM